MDSTTVRGFLGSPDNGSPKSTSPTQTRRDVHGSAPQARECVPGNDEPKVCFQRLPRHPDGANGLEEKQTPWEVEIATCSSKANPKQIIFMRTFYRNVKSLNHSPVAPRDLDDRESG